MPNTRPLSPAVLELRLLAATFALPGVAWLVAAVFGIVDPKPVLAGMVVGLPIFIGVLWLATGRGFVRDVVQEAEPVPPDAELAGSRRTLRRVLMVQVPLDAIIVAALLISPGVVGVIIGGSLYWLVLAAQLRSHERATNRRYVHRLRYRFAGTNGRRSGRGWFDPADFFVLEPSA